MGDSRHRESQNDDSIPLGVLERADAVGGLERKKQPPSQIVQRANNVLTVQELEQPNDTSPPSGRKCVTGSTRQNHDRLSSDVLERETIGPHAAMSKEGRSREQRNDGHYSSGELERDGFPGQWSKQTKSPNGLERTQQPPWWPNLRANDVLAVYNLEQSKKTVGGLERHRQIPLEIRADQTSRRNEKTERMGIIA